MSQETMEWMRQRLAGLGPQTLHIEDQSHLHAGHAGAASGGHYTLKMVAGVFAGQPVIARHRLIHEALGNLAECKIHALTIHASAPEEV